MDWKNFWTWTAIVQLTVIVYILLFTFLNHDITILKEKNVQARIEDVHPRYGHLEKHGLPTYINILERKHYLASYDTRNKVPFWVMEHVTSDMITAEKLGNRKDAYYGDKTIHENFRSTNKDYRNSGYDKGHAACANNYRYSQEAVNETFYLSGIFPQVRNVNRGAWNRLEKLAQDMAVYYGSVYICCGPLFLPREKKTSDGKIKKYIKFPVIGENNVSVPTHFFKVILCEVEENVYDMFCYIVPDTDLGHRKNLDSLKVSKKEIEKAAGFLIFNDVPLNTFRYINGSLINEENLSSTTIPGMNLQLAS